jgi:hypothetical protein
MTQLENHMSQPCLTVLVYKIFGLFILNFLSPSLLQYAWINIIGCTPSAPDGSSPRGYSQILSGIGSRKIDRLVPYISSRDICRLYLPFQLFSPSYDTSPRVKDKVSLCFFLWIFSYTLSFLLSFSSSFLYASFFPWYVDSSILSAL